jgi:hypothetical protein
VARSANRGREARDDIDGVLSTLTPDCEHDVVGWPSGPSIDHEQARKLYEVRIPRQGGQVFQLDRGQPTDLMAATIPI